MHLLALFMNMEKNVLLYLQFAKSIDDCKNLYKFLKQLIIYFQYYKTKPKSNPEMSSPSKTNLLSIIMNQKNKPKNSKKFSGSMPNLSSEHTEAVLQSTTNTTSHLRRAFNAKKKQIYDKNEILEKRKVLTNEMRQIEMRENHPAWQRLRFEVVDHNEIEAKKSQRLLETKERARDYKLDLEKMMIRVQNQPTLFERQSAVSAYNILS